MWRGRRTSLLFPDCIILMDYYIRVLVTMMPTDSPNGMIVEMAYKPSPGSFLPSLFFFT